MNIRPLRDNIVVKKVEVEDKTSGGIILTESAKEKPTNGVVIAVGKGRILEDGSVKPVDVKVGDLVMFGKFAGQTFKDKDGNDLLVIRESEIIGVWEE